MGEKGRSCGDPSLPLLGQSQLKRPSSLPRVCLNAPLLLMSSRVMQRQPQPQPISLAVWDSDPELVCSRQGWVLRHQLLPGWDGGARSQERTLLDPP